MWAGYMEESVTMEGPLKTPPGGTLVTDQIARMHTEFEQIVIKRMDIECIIIQSYHLLRELDRNHPLSQAPSNVDKRIKPLKVASSTTQPGE